MGIRRVGWRRVSCRLKLYDVSRLDAPVAFTFLELDGLAFVQRAETRALDLSVMHEDLVSILARDESVALGVVEPLDGAPRHERPPAPGYPWARHRKAA